MMDIRKSSTKSKYRIKFQDIILNQKILDKLTRKVQQTDWKSVIECDNVKESYNKFVEIFSDKLNACCPKETKTQR